MIQHKQIFIDGKWIDSSGRDVLTVVNPATEEPVATIPRGSADDVDRAVQAAAKAFPGWSRSSIDERSRIFTRLARLTEARSAEITHTVVTELGYPITFATKSQTAGAVEELDIIAETLGEISWAEQIGNTTVRREAAGVVGGITAWNAPLRSVISKAGAAIAAGCTVVCKPAEVAPLTAFMFAQMCAEAGLPPGVFNLVCGTGPEVGEAIASHPLIDMVSLTGSVRAGRRVMEVAAAHDQARAPRARRQVGQPHHARRRLRARGRRRHPGRVPQRGAGVRRTDAHARSAASTGGGRGAGGANGEKLCHGRSVRPEDDARSRLHLGRARSGARIHQVRARTRACAW